MSSAGVKSTTTPPPPKTLADLLAAEVDTDRAFDLIDGEPFELVELVVSDLFSEG